MDHDRNSKWIIVPFIVSTSFFSNFQTSGGDTPMIIKNQVKEKNCPKYDQKKVEKSFDLNQILDPTLTHAIIAILSDHFHQKIHITSLVQLSEAQRRNRIIRVGIGSPEGSIPTSLIFKQTLKEGTIENDEDSLRRFSRDWAGLEFLGHLKFEFVPQFYGGSLKHRFVLLEDLGEQHVSLVDSLTSSNSQEAEAALFRYVKCLGQFHAASYEKTHIYSKILHKLNPASEPWETDLKRYLEKTLPKFESLFTTLGISESRCLWEELKGVFKANIEPGSFTTLTHGDICPDNVFDNPQKNEMHLIDFEHAAVRSALLDATYLRMSMPTCWCARAIPPKLVQSLEVAYREELMKKIPAAKDDKAYDTAYVNACAFWMLKGIVNIKNILDKEDVCGSGPTPKNSLWKLKRTFCDRALFLGYKYLLRFRENTINCPL
jgi:thiamine kinase-like enzyme